MACGDFAFEAGAVLFSRDASPILQPAMMLENIRAIGADAIEATCECGHRARVDVSHLAGSIEVPSLPWRLRYSSVESGLSMPD